jgi:DNA polymerase sigma
LKKLRLIWRKKKQAYCNDASELSNACFAFPGDVVGLERNERRKKILSDFVRHWVRVSREKGGGEGRGEGGEERKKCYRRERRRGGEEERRRGGEEEGVEERERKREREVRKMKKKKKTNKQTKGERKKASTTTEQTQEQNKTDTQNRHTEQKQEQTQRDRDKDTYKTESDTRNSALIPSAYIWSQTRIVTSKGKV